MHPRFTVLPFLAAGLAAQLTCTVDDPRSHGVLGDAFLSLDEAVRVANGTLLLSQLSAQERARFAGIGAVLERILLDPQVTPVITLERVLSPLYGQQHAHVDLELQGGTTPGGARVEIRAGNEPVGLPLRTNHAHVHGVVIRGGQVGIDYDTTLHFHPGAVAELGELHCEGQTVAGIRVHNPPSPSGMQAPLALHDVEVHGAPVGLRIVDQSVFGTVDVTGEHLALADCALGIDVDIQATGGDHRLALWSTTITGAQDGVRTRRNAGSTARWQVSFVHGEVRAARRGIDVETNAAGATTLGVHHLRVTGGALPGDCALRTAPRDGRLTLLLTDDVLDGDMALAGTIGGGGLRAENNHVRNGATTLEFAGGSGTLHWTTFTSQPVTVAAGNTSPLTLELCEFVRSPIGNASAGASWLTACYRASSPLSGPVVDQTPVTAPWIGRATVTPSDPPLGGFVDLGVDLPPGIAAAWLLGTAAGAPNVQARQFRFYFDLTAFVQLPGVVTLQDRLRLPVPSTSALRGLSLYAQPVQAPVAGQPFVPPVFLPVGGRFTIGA